MSTLRLAFQVIEGLTRHLGCLVDDLLFLPVPLDAFLMEVVGEKQAIATAQGINLESKISLPNFVAYSLTPKYNMTYPRFLTIATAQAINLE